MAIYHGIVRNNRVEINGGAHLVEGQRVEVRLRDDDKADEEDSVATARVSVHSTRGELPSERTAPSPPEPGTVDAAFLAGLDDAYGEGADTDDRLVEGMRVAFRRVLEPER